MIRKCTLLLAAIIALATGAKAQLCGFDQQHAALMASNPVFAAKIQQQNLQWSQFIQGNGNSLIVNTPLGPVYEIPVVIHVIHTGGAIGSTYNPSVAQLTGMIDYLNSSYAATWAAYPDTNNGGTRFPIRFALAKRDPNCNASTGINRINGVTALGSTLGSTYNTYGIQLSSANGVPEANVKALSIWPNTQYYNVWVVNRIDGADGISGSGVYTAGYAYFPGAGANIDGTVMLASKAIAGEITLPHEVGHAFNLYHTFQGDGGGGTCPTNVNCATDGDQVCDTDPEKRSVFNCPTGTNPCTGTAYGSIVHNFMDYSSCQDRFTPGQRTRWLFALMNYRASLISSLGATALPSTSMTAPTCVPSINSGTSSNTFNAGVYETVFNDMTATTDGGYNDDGNQAYLDLTCKQRANVVAGSTYTLKVTTGPNPERVAVYIDWNNDGTFATTELVYSHTGTGSYETHTGSVTVPTTAVTCTPIRMRVLSDRTTAATPTSCSVLSYGQGEDYSVMVTGVSNSSTISITASPNPSCIGSTVTFTATTTGSPTAPSYKWFVNGIQQAATGTTFTSSTIANGAVVTARLLYTAACGADSSSSNSITVVRQASLTPFVSIAVTSGSNPGCAGQPITFTATPTNGGTTPTYQWKVNGVIQTGVTGNTFTTSSLTNGNTVNVTMTTSLSCATTTTANSNTITYTTTTGQTATAFIFISSGSNPVCYGRPVTFTATVTNGGTTPTYQWLLNGAAVTGANGLTYTTNTLNNGDSVKFLLISSSPCVTNQSVISNTIRMVVNPSDSPKVTSAITIGSNPGCKDSLLQFTATGTNTGPTPAYAWYVNGVKVANGPTYNNTALNNGDVVVVRMIASGPTCHLYDTAYSTPITVTVTPTPAAPVISFIGSTLVSDSANVQWYGPSGLIPGATGQTYNPTVPGYYYAKTVINGCASKPSNLLLISLLSIGKYDLTSVHIYPNPTSGELMLDWGSRPATARIMVYNTAGQIVLQEVAENAFRKTINLASVANGTYFVVLQDEAGKKGTVRINVQH